jgi:NADPH:quinone reductase-like Zn-dependent oxidoreductase
LRIQFAEKYQSRIGAINARRRVAVDSECNAPFFEGSPKSPDPVKCPSAARLNKITELSDSGKLVTDVGTVLPLEKARIAHEMLGAASHKRGKIVLSIAA